MLLLAESKYAVISLDYKVRVKKCPAFPSRKIEQNHVVTSVLNFIWWWLLWFVFFEYKKFHSDLMSKQFTKKDHKVFNSTFLGSNMDWS